MDNMKAPHTTYRKSVKAPKTGLLKPGSNNKKLGFNVTKGKWKGKKLYSLTLEERATCPTDCHHWEDCYGNNMPFAHRFSTDGLEDKIRADIERLLEKHSNGILVRLHVLGDFYSKEYVEFWGRMLYTFPKLAIFGYSARYTDNVIGPAIIALNDSLPNQCLIRFSANVDYFPFIDFKFAANESFQGDSFICPEQTGKVKSCADCALCWTANKTVKFLSH